MMRNSHGIPIIGVVGWKNSGKTTLTVRLIECFRARGLRVASVKHAHHKFHIDEGDQDSARHRKAGASEVAIISPYRWAMISEAPSDAAREPDFSDVIDWFTDADIIVVEGYKSQPIPKIEARRDASVSRAPMAPGDPNVIAIAADRFDDGTETGLPQFNLDDAEAIAGFVADRLGLATEHNS